MMWNQRKIFEKMSEGLNYDLFGGGGPKWPGNWASGANIQHNSKSSSNWHVHQDWCETSGKLLRKWTAIFTYFEAQSGPKFGPLRPIFSTHLKVLAMSMSWKQYWCETSQNLWESDQTPNFLYLRWGPKWPRNWVFEAHILHISESSTNEHKKQDWCESRVNF